MSHNKMNLSQTVNSIGKFLYKHIDSAHKITFGPNTCDVFITLYYQIPGEVIKKYHVEDDRLHEMNIDISLTQYDSKVRINTIEMDDLERTLGFDTFEPEKIGDLHDIHRHIYQTVCKRVAKAYEDYEFVF